MSLEGRLTAVKNTIVGAAGDKPPRYNEMSRETRIPSSNFSAGLIILLRARARCIAHRRMPGRWSALYQANYHISRAAVHLRSGYRDGEGDVTVLREGNTGDRPSLEARSNHRRLPRDAQDARSYFLSEVL